MREKRTDKRRRRRLIVGKVLTTGCLSAFANYSHSAEMVSVSGHWTGAQAEVVWSTGIDYGTAGFRVLRQAVGGEVSLDDGWVPADITRPGGDYRVVDVAGAPGGGATYRIEALSREGTIETLGTWRVTFEAPTDQPVMRAMAAEPLFLPMGEPGLAPAPAAKVWVVSNDVYAVSYEALGAVLGLTAGEVADRAAEASLVMRCDDELVAYWPDNGRLLFYGWQAKRRYTPYNVYWIEPGVPGSGRLMARVAPENEPVSPDLTFMAQVDFERDLVSMVDHSGVLREDLYFWTHIFSGHATDGERTFSLPLEGYIGGDVEVTVRVTGWTDVLAVDPDHQIDVRMNDTLIGTFTFDGKADAQATVTAPTTSVMGSGNVLKIRGVLQPNVVSSTVVIQGYALAYQQDYGLRGGPLLANDGGHGRLSADGYADPVVLNITDPHDAIRVTDEHGELPAGWSWSAGTDTRWVYRERAAVPALMPAAAGHGTWLRAATNTVDYLVLAPRAFEAPAQRLADYRAGQGLRVAVAVYEDVCDQFAQGRNSPEAIRSLLIQARETWVASPWMVVLGGWGHYDYYGAQTTAVNHLPSLLGSDSRYLRPADGLFADLTGNEVPDLAIGRIPAQSVAAFNGYIDKLQAYEAGGVEGWHGNAFFIADNADGGGDFTATNVDLAVEAVNRYVVTHTTLDSNGVAQVRSDIQAAFTNGSGIIHYTGHGTYKQLADENLLHYDAVTGMANPSVPLFVSLTCLIGRFDIYLSTQRSLSEGLVLNPNGGSLAVYAPAGLSWNVYAAFFGEELYRLHAGDQADTIGLLLLRARQSFGPLSGLHADAIRTYNLLGDPALKLQGGAGGTPPWWSPTFPQWRWESLSYGELAASAGDPESAGVEAYVLGGGSQGLRLSMEREASGGGVSVGWDQRKVAEDLDYRLMLSTNLVSGSWEVAPVDLPVSEFEHPDPAWIRREAAVPFDSDQLFMRLEVFTH